MKAHIFNIHDVVLLMTIAECLLLAIFQAVLPVTNRLASLLLTSFLLCIAIGSSCTLILWNGFVHISPLFDQYLLPYFLVTALLLKGPILYFYVVALTQEGFQLKPSHLWHAAPVLVTFIWLMVFGIASADLSFRTQDSAKQERELVNSV